MSEPRSTATRWKFRSTPTLTSEAVEASGAQSGPTSVVALTSGGITINLLFDAAAMAAPASFRAGIQQAASILTAAISDKITVNIKIDYSGTGGGAAAGPDNGLYESYSTVRADLINNARRAIRRSMRLPSGIIDPGAIQCRRLERAVEALGVARRQRHHHRRRQRHLCDRYQSEPAGRCCAS